MDDQRVPKEILRQSVKQNKRGRCRTGWLYDVLKDLKRMGVKVYAEMVTLGHVGELSNSYFIQIELTYFYTEMRSVFCIFFLYLHLPKP